MNIVNITVRHDNLLFHFCSECFKYITWIEMILTTIELLMFYSYKKTLMCVFLVYLPQFKHRVRAILTQEIS